MSDFLQDQSSVELTGWLATARIEDELWTNRIIHAIVKAFGGGKKQTTQRIEDEEIIDTTDPKFVEQFQGFTYGKPLQRRPRQTSTEILRG